MWRIKAPQRIKTFMCLVMNEALLTNYSRLRSNMLTNDLCASCGTNFETTLHVLCDCVKVQELWKSIRNSFIEKSFL